MKMPFAQIQVLACPLAATTYAGAVAWVRDMAVGGGVYLVEAANTMVVTMARHEREFGAVIDRFDLCLPDGMPLVWAMNRQLPEDEQMGDRVYGPTLMLRCFEGTQDDSAPGHFLLGGKESTLEKLVTEFGEIAPGATIMGTYSPPFGEWPEGEDDRICDLIRESGAKLIWVGLGCPKQEMWMARMRDRLPGGVYFGIGAAFAFHAGEVSQAPAFMQKRGMEWLYRLCMEPRRLFSRYFKFNSLFLFYMLKDRIFGVPRG
ncbi:MAG: N-acetylglucosaminyldiphosphoundecaprenol N-acetyl-beta-D-mannosaminyltransferase [Verrucomicrobiales bacterium]|jgi:N-acetylglucosaminyldiphosphoundecaprenol N-acetyl-beta-D-mannosaminyltransferase